MKRGLLLVGHGTRDQRGQAEFSALAGAIAARIPGLPVQPAFLELLQPSVEEGLRRLADAQVRQVVVQPLLLIAAGHLKQDLPRAVQGAARTMHVELAPHLGSYPLVVRVSAERFLQAAGPSTAQAARETLTILVGRGTSDPEGRAEFARFAHARQACCPTGGFEHCFVAAAEPSLHDTLWRAASTPYKRVVVQPHLLFRGEVWDSIAQQVDRLRDAVSHKEWLLAPHLGPHPALAALAAIHALDAEHTRIEQAGREPSAR
ncbi:MAG: sirohydrochlorin chelatase [Pirellulales bacterium]|nr:sirohydrochlorin chelatase [Pirellulales bacterium]